MGSEKQAGAPDVRLFHWRYLSSELQGRHPLELLKRLSVTILCITFILNGRVSAAGSQFMIPCWRCRQGLSDWCRSQWRSLYSSIKSLDVRLDELDLGD